MSFLSLFFSPLLAVIALLARRLFCDCTITRSSFIRLPYYNGHNECRARRHMQTRDRFELGDGTRCAVEDGANAQLPVLAPSPRHDAQEAILWSEGGGKMFAACNELDAFVASRKRHRCAC